MAVLDEGSPLGSRQVIRKYNIKHEYVPLCFSDLTTPTPRQNEGVFLTSVRKCDESSKQVSANKGMQD